MMIEELLIELKRIRDFHDADWEDCNEGAMVSAKIDSIIDLLIKYFEMQIDLSESIPKE
jgi:hypothetical protein